MRTTHSNLAFDANRQQGVALIVALIVLVAMTMAAITIVRSTDTAALIAGNLSFRQGATMAGDTGVEAARTWLMTTAVSLEQNSPSDGYYATRQEAGTNPIDLTGNRTPTNLADDVAWPGTSGQSSAPKCLAKDAAGNTACYIIHRLCDLPGALDVANGCLAFEATGSGSGSGSGISQSAAPRVGTYGKGSWDPGSSGGSTPVMVGYYQVTVRVAAPRNNVSFIQTVVLR